MSPVRLPDRAEWEECAARRWPDAETGLPPQSPQARVDYQEYLRSPWWAERKARALWLAGGRCEECGKPGPLEVHHLTYERLGQESDDDLVVLCVRHHEARRRNGGEG